MKRRLLLILCCCLVSVLIAIGIYMLMKVPHKRDLYALKGELRFLALERLAEKLKVGMTKNDVQALLGRPDNVDSSNVWLWTSSDANMTKQIHWVDCYNENGYFLLFHQDKLISPLLKTTETTPWEYYRIVTGCDQAEAEKTLGQKPRIIEDK